MASLVVGGYLLLFLEFLHRVGFLAVLGRRGGGHSDLHGDTEGLRWGLWLDTSRSGVAVKPVTL